MARTRLQSRHDDAGVALVMVLGIVSVSVILLTTLALTTIFTLKTTARTKAEMAVLASADAGIDFVFGQLDGKTFAQLSTVCSPAYNYLVNNDTVTVKTLYTLDDGTKTNCPSATDIVTVLRVTSTAVSGNKTLDGPLKRTVVATFATTPPSATLDKAIFSDASLDLINNTQVVESAPGVLDANVYSNGQITIRTQVNVDGQIYSATGDVTVDNKSLLKGTLWAAGRVTLATQATVQGDVYSASPLVSTSTPAVSLDSSNTIVTGDVLANGTIVSQGRTGNSGGILGIAFSRVGQVLLQNDATVGGSIYAGGNITLAKSTVGGDVISTGGDVVASGTPNLVAGKVVAKGAVPATSYFSTPKPTSLTGNTASDFPTGTAINPSTTQFQAGVGYPYLIVAPKRESLPKDGMALADIKAWPGWTLDPSTSCDSSDPMNFIRDNPNGITGPRMIVFTCASGKPVNIDGTGNKTITLSNDLALVSTTGFYQTNNVTYTGTNATDPWTLFWLVPSDSLGVDWKPAAVSGQYYPVCTTTPTDSKNLYWDQMKVTKLVWFSYTPCTVEFKNGNNLTGNTDPMTGQIYAGAFKAGAATKIQMTKVAIPSLGGDPLPTDPAAVRLTSRFDLRD